MIVCINKVLKDAKADKSVKSDSLPKTLKEEDVKTLTILLELLEPFAALTDTLQGDGVTSSLAIPGLINAIKGSFNLAKKKYNKLINNDFTAAESVDVEAIVTLMNFKQDLVKSVKERFTTDKDSGEKVLNEKGNARQIVTINLPKIKSYILATLLDPRIKGTPFVEGEFIISQSRLGMFQIVFFCIQTSEKEVLSRINCQL
jgi:hypothetical protein